MSFRELQSRSGVTLSAGAMEGNLKNVLVLSFGFLLLFTAYGGLQSLQVGVRRPPDLPLGTARDVGCVSGSPSPVLYSDGGSQFRAIAQLLVSDPGTRRAGLGRGV